MVRYLFYTIGDLAYQSPLVRIILYLRKNHFYFHPSLHPVLSLGLHTAHGRLLDPNLFNADSELSVKSEIRAVIGMRILLPSKELQVAISNKYFFRLIL